MDDIANSIDRRVGESGGDAVPRDSIVERDLLDHPKNNGAARCVQRVDTGLIVFVEREGRFFIEKPGFERGRVIGHTGTYSGCRPESPRCATDGIVRMNFLRYIRPSSDAAVAQW